MPVLLCLYSGHQPVREGALELNQATDPAILLERKQDKMYYALLTRAMPEWDNVKTRLDRMAELLLNQ